MEGSQTIIQIIYIVRIKSFSFFFLNLLIAITPRNRCYVINKHFNDHFLLCWIKSEFYILIDGRFFAINSAFQRTKLVFLKKELSHLIPHRGHVFWAKLDFHLIFISNKNRRCIFQFFILDREDYRVRASIFVRKN